MLKYYTGELREHLEYLLDVRSDVILLSHHLHHR